MAAIEGLFIYPFKSGRGIAVAGARLGERGLQWDRHWMAATPAGRFLSQRTHPRLALVVPELAGDCLRLSAPGQPDLQLPLDAGSNLQAHPAAATTVQVWDDSCTAIDEGEDAARWISTLLGESARVVRVAPESNRRANPRYAGHQPVALAFADAFPILLCNRASLDDLNRRMPEPVPMERFRPNLVLEGLAAFAEDDIEMLVAGAIQLRLVKPCTRCIITSTDQHTGERTTNPLPVLRTFRFNRELLGVTFGENAVVAQGSGATLHVGMTVEPVRRTKPPSDSCR